MKDRSFLDKSNQPTEQAIQAALGSTYPYYENIIGLVSAYSKDWTFTKNSGWMLKIFDRKKALLYLIPLTDGFKISLTIRETEREAFLRDDELEMLQDKTLSAKKFPEGYALQFDITNQNEFQPLALFIKKLIARRREHVYDAALTSRRRL